jgi:transposase
MPGIDWNLVAKKLSYTSEKEMWEDLYIRQVLSLSELGKRFGVSFFSIRNALIRNKIPRRSRGGPNNTLALPPEFFSYLAEHGPKDAAAHFGISYSAAYNYQRLFRRMAEEKIAEEQRDGEEGEG